MSRLGVLALLVVALGVFAAFCLVILDEREQGFRTVLGRPDPVEPVLTDPGVYLRIPGVHSIDVYDKRVQRYDAEPREVQLKDGKLFDVDYYVAYRIENPQLFREQVAGSQDELRRQLDDNTFSQVRDTLANYPLDSLLSPARSQVMAEVTAGVARTMASRGILVVDVRLKRTDYPEANLPQTFNRMNKERERFARKFRAEGEEESRKVRSKADLDAQVLRADAQRQAAELRGEGDSQAIGIYAEAYNQDPEFYGFIRSLEAYRLALDDQTTVILSPKVPFLRHLFEQNGQGGR